MKPRNVFSFIISFICVIRGKNRRVGKRIKKYALLIVILFRKNYCLSLSLVAEKLPIRFFGLTFRWREFAFYWTLISRGYFRQPTIFRVNYFTAQALLRTLSLRRLFDRWLLFRSFCLRRSSLWRLDSFLPISYLIQFLPRCNFTKR